MTEAIVVGSGPNGLAAAATLARAGVRVTVLEAADEIGGGTRSGELTLPGLLHDHCSSAHPTGVASPCFRDLELERHGVRWRWADVDLAHPMDSGGAGILTRSLAETAAALGRDGPAWRGMFGPLAANADNLVAELLRPVLHLPRHPLVLARYGLGALLPASVLARRWRDEPARALFAGLAAHLFGPLNRPLSSALGLMFGAVGHAYGWPVAQGGSHTITKALAAILAEHGGKIETGVRVRTLAELPTADVVLLDLMPRAAADLLGGRLPDQVDRAFRRFRHGPAAYKIDLAVQGGIPWTSESCRRAGTVHLGGSADEVVRIENEMSRGAMPARPFMLVSQQYLADPERSRDDVHPISAYAHVPHSYQGDATEPMLRQLERFAPGARERVLRLRVTAPADLTHSNPNYVGGDIVSGANTIRQMALRPRPTLAPYSTGVPGVFLCSAATPPGAGVHGMCGHNAASSALRYLE